MTPPAPVAVLQDVGLAYGKTRALDGVSLELPAGVMVGLIGPDGVGKSTLLSLVAGSRAVQRGTVHVLGGDIADRHHRAATCPRIAYMPQGLGKNLYPTLSVTENLDFFARLFGHDRDERERRIAELLASTRLAPFAARPAGQLSGGMKQKLGLCCALIHDPDLLILDEPTTGVDPLSRREFWELIDQIRAARPGMSVLVATAYMEEAARFDWLVALDGGKLLAAGTPAALLERTGARDLDAAFIALLPEERRRGHAAVAIPPRRPGDGVGAIIEADHLTMRFDGFTAVDDVSFRIERGEIFGFVGSNGCGKTTTMKLLTGLLSPSEGQARLVGRPLDARDLGVRRRVGYMSQSFSLYTELTVEQNLALHARLFGIAAGEIAGRVRSMTERFGLAGARHMLPDQLPLGVRQRLSLAVAMIHGPEILILDEPTSGVDPIARDAFWQELGDLSRREDVTIFVSTHFMNEAALCDRVALMHAGRLLATDAPAAIAAARGVATLEEAFISHLEEAHGVTPGRADGRAFAARSPSKPPRRSFDLRRLLAFTRRESLELRRDPIRATLAILGTVILMFVMGYGINMDIERLTFAVLDHDDTSLSRDYAQQIAGSRYFVEEAPLTSYDDLDRRMRNGSISLALEIPPGFARDVAHGRDVSVGAWIDGAMPTRAETIQGYVQGMHQTWLAEQARERYGAARAGPRFDIEVRYRYNPGIESLVAMVPAVIPLLLLMIPAMLAALSVVREKELGSIVNFYVTPVTRLEFLLGKQIPYLLLAFGNFFMLTAFAVFVFRVPLTGSFALLTLAAFLYVAASTTMGLVISSFMKTQIAAIFGTTLVTLIPAVQFCGVIDPVSSLEGAGAVIGRIYPTSYFITVSRGVFSKALGAADLSGQLVPLALAVPVLLALGALLLRKQAR